jgi:hypothetical protein
MARHTGKNDEEARGTGSMNKLQGDEKKAAIRGVPGAFGRKDEEPKPREGDKHSAINRGKDPADADKGE